MDFIRLLFREKIALMILLIGFMPVTACMMDCMSGSSKLKYDNILFMSATRKNDTIILEMSSWSSIKWINHSYKIEDDFIYLSGKETFVEKPYPYLIKIPDVKRHYKLFWIDGDGTKTEIPVKWLKKQDVY